MPTVDPTKPTRRTLTPRGQKLPDDAAERVKEGTDIVALIQGDGVVLKREGHEYKGLCPLHNESSPSFSVSPSKRIWHCFGCGEGGDAVDWMVKKRGLGFVEAVRALAAMGGIVIDTPTGGAVSPPPAGGPTRRTGAKVGTVGGGGGESPKPKGPRRPTPFDFTPTLDADCHADLMFGCADGDVVREYLTNDRKISMDAIRHFRLGVLVLRRADGTTRARFLSIPCYDRHGALLTVRFRTIPGPCLDCDGTNTECRSCKGKGKGVLKAYLHCPDRPLPLFNVASLTADTSKTVLLTEGELDVIAAWDYGIRDNVVTGTGGAGKFDEAWYDDLEPYRGFVMCQDGDVHGDEAGERDAKRLGLYRCSRAVLPKKDLGDCLQAGVSISEVQNAIQHARPMVTAKYATASSYRQQIEDRIAKPSLLVGLPTGSSKLDRIIGGWRPGLVVITGSTGSGKTSFTAWAAREQALRGVPTLVTCFEQSPIELAEKHLRMEVGGDFTKVDAATRDAAWARHDAMPAPMHYVDHYGRMNKDELFEAIRYAVRRFDVRWAMIDHAGYVKLGAGEDTSKAAAEMDDLMIDLATLGKNEGCCLVTVCHPNRMWTAQGRDRPGMSDLKGGSGIEQNAQAVLVVVRNEIGKAFTTPSTTFHLDKVRSEFGVPGSSCVLAYDPLATTYADDWLQTPMGRAGKGAGLVVPSPSTGPVEVPTKRGSARRGDE
jgi:hypothetical protein